MMRQRTRVPLPFCDDDADESQQASSDYFWMLTAGITGDNTRATWRSFRGGYAAMTAFYREGECDAPITRMRCSSSWRREGRRGLNSTRW